MFFASHHAPDGDDSFYRPALDISYIASARRSHATDYSRTAKKGRKFNPAALENGNTSPDARFVHVQQARQALHNRLIKQAEEETEIGTYSHIGNAREQRIRGNALSGRMESSNEVEKRSVIREHRVSVRLNVLAMLID